MSGLISIVHFATLSNTPVFNDSVHILILLWCSALRVFLLKRTASRGRERNTTRQEWQMSGAELDVGA